MTRRSQPDADTGRARARAGKDAGRGFFAGKGFSWSPRWSCGRRAVDGQALSFGGRRQVIDAYALFPDLLCRAFPIKGRVFCNRHRRERAAVRQSGSAACRRQTEIRRRQSEEPAQTAFSRTRPGIRRALGHAGRSAAYKTVFLYSGVKDLSIRSGGRGGGSSGCAPPPCCAVWEKEVTRMGIGAGEDGMRMTVPNRRHPGGRRRQAVPLALSRPGG